MDDTAKLEWFRAMLSAYANALQSHKNWGLSEKLYDEIVKILAWLTIPDGRRSLDLLDGLHRMVFDADSSLNSQFDPHSLESFVLRNMRMLIECGITKINHEAEISRLQALMHDAILVRWREAIYPPTETGTYIVAVVIPEGRERPDTDETVYACVFSQVGWHTSNRVIAWMPYPPLPIYGQDNQAKSKGGL